MRGLFLSLPPFSPDYSGVCSSLLELGALLVVHDGTGCTGNYICHDEPRAQLLTNMVYTSNLREMEVVMGDDEAFLEKVQRAAADLEPRMIVLMNSPAPLVIGTDFRALARIVEKRTQIPTLFFNTNGMRLYDWGVEKALLQAVQRFSGALAGRAAPGGVAVLGATPLNLGNPQNALLLKETVEQALGRETTVIGMGSAPDSLGAAANAALNLVICAAAVPAAQWCEEQYGVPWLAMLPVGESGVAALREQAASVLNHTPPAHSPDARVPAAHGRRALVLHEQVTANGFRSCLRREFGYTHVDVGSFFALRPELAESGDLHLAEELEFAQTVTAGRYDEVYCDRLLQGVLKDCGARLIDLPHMAVSAMMCYPMEFCPIGPAAGAYLRERLHERN